MANNLPRWACVALSIFSISLPALAVDNYKEFRRDHWDFEVNANYFYSEANYPASGGGSQSLVSGNSYSLIDTSFGTRYVPKKNWSIFGWGTISNAESKDSVASRSNSSISEAAVGFDFLMYSDLFQLIPEVIAVIPFEEVNPASDTVLNSEGVFEVRSRLIAQKDFGTLRGYGWLGFNYRGSGRSFLMPWGVGAQMKMQRLRLGAELFGYQSVSDDTTDVTEALRTSYINSVNAGSMKFYSVKPNLMDSQLYATWLISPKLSVQANGGMTLTGSNSAAGFHVGGFIRYSFDMSEGYSEPEYAPPVENPVPNYRSNMYEESDLSSEKKVRRFKEQTSDGVDQNLFKPRPTQPKKRPRVDDELQQQLDDTEFQIELKSNKKKRR
ncbi:hypothetical protein ACES2I_02185 [Bdellovibrio bacteriovorus]|uniref:hypothetical protein n=1 Tax=Bdellovibrio bacteriovorus TaxID=959 RepID=UPI0035A6442D